MIKINDSSINREERMRHVGTGLSGMVLSGVMALVTVSVVAALPDGASDKTLSPYFFVQSDDPADRMPLKSTTADVTISGVIADVTVTQIYSNEGKNTLEAVYVFPGSTRAAVYAMRMTVGERTIEAKIREREKARATYTQALSEGKTASLLEQQRPNVFRMNVGNILPGDEITVTLRYTEIMVPDNAVYEFVYPTVVGPRYSNKPETGAGPGDRWVANPYLEEGKESPFTFAFTCRINGGMPIAKCASPSHDIDVKYSGKTGATVALKQGTAANNRDVVIRYCLAGDAIESGLLLNIGRQEDFFLLMIEPPERVAAAMVVPREYIFVLDVSGSMRGFPIETARTLMQDLFSTLSGKDYFNVLLFAGGNAVLSPQSLPAGGANLKNALDVISRECGGGGTELMPALRNAMALPKADENISRSIIIITDGFVDVEKDAFDYINRNLHRGNVFTFGIGSSVNRHLIEGMARAGMGEPFIVLNPGEAKGVAARFRSYIDSPVLTDIKVAFDGLKVADVEPASIPDLFAKKPVVLFGKYEGTPKGTITITGKAAGKPYKNELRVSEGKISTKNRALRYLWARHRIIRLADRVKLSPDDKRVAEITQLGLSCNLLTDYTSFVAVDNIKRAQGAPQESVKQPNALPQGVSNAAVAEGQAARPARSPGTVRKIMEIEKLKSTESKLEPELELLKKQLEKEEDKNVSPPPPPPPPERKTPAGPGDKRAELMEKIRKLEESKRRLRENVSKKTETAKPAGKEIPEIIARYEKLLSNCTVKKSDRCADVIYTLGGLYYDKSRDEYIRARESYERARDSAERHPGTPEPQNPVPDYSAALKLYERLITEYPDFVKLSEAYYQMGTIYQLLGDLDKTKEAFKTLIDKYPKSPRVSGAHSRLSGLVYLDRDNAGTIAHLEKINETEVDVQTWERVHYRKAEVYYNLKEYDKAANLFYTYVEKCDAGLYPKREFRDMALEFMAMCYADMKDGPAKAAKFFKKVGPKPYEPYVLYTIGWKTERAGQTGRCIAALSTALKKFPLSYEAPPARRTLAECYTARKEFVKANKEREFLADDYGPQSKWAAANAGRHRGEGGGLRSMQREALSAVTSWYYAHAVKGADPLIIGKAHRRCNEFIDRFAFDKWRCYELRYRIAVLYEKAGDCKNAAEQYRIIAMEDLSGYPEYRPDTVADAVEAAIGGAPLQTPGPKIAQDEAGYKAIVLLDDCLKRKMVAGGIPAGKSYELPETRQIPDFAAKFLARFPQSARAAGVLRLAGNIHYTAGQRDKAEECFRQADELFKAAEAAKKPPVLDEKAIKEVRSKRAELLRK